ncbi:MAG TPA: N-alpha-acetyl diaminobutyric acid deacetylase DoeB, partial [Agrobacterium sp.]|nr:N-alpha-acetyl diaminobutyric acid deacetylase DoeB [Agrobacterium sp.]
ATPHNATITLLRHAATLPGAAVPAPSRWLDMPSSDCFTFAEDDGLVVFVRDLGDTVKAGETIARVYPVGKTGLAPVEYRASISGVLAARHVPGLIKAGDCLSVIATVTENT